MTFFVALTIFEMFYLTWYAGALALCAVALDKVLPKGGIASIPPLQLVFFGLFLGALFVSGRRAYHAAQAYGERNMSFWEAHTVAGALMKAELSYLPLVGQFFGGNDE